jgi:copper oxidase (laccase) domain-containing protein
LLTQAQRSGLPCDSIFSSPYCTRCHNHLFHSFRAEGREGLQKMWGVIGCVR